MSNKFWFGYVAFFVFIFPLFFSYSAMFPSSAIFATISLAIGFTVWIFFISQTYKHTIVQPRQMQKSMQSTLRNGHLEKGEIIEKILLARGKNQMESIEILVRFKNLSGTLVTHHFQFIDSKPYEKRFEEGNRISLRISTKQQSPLVVIEGLQTVFSPKSGIIALAFLVLYMVGTFAGHYFFFSDGKGWRFLNLWHPWILTPFIGLLAFTFLDKLFKGFGGNSDHTEQLLLYGKPATAIVQRADQTGTYINEQPQIRFILKFTDDKGTSHSVTMKKIISLTQMHKYQTGNQPILYLPEDPQKIMFVD